MMLPSTILFIPQNHQAAGPPTLEDPLRCSAPAHPHGTCFQDTAEAAGMSWQIAHSFIMQ
jgi:hypothetical protein